MYDFHTHTFLSDGVLSPIELIRRAYCIGYQVMAITDHVGVGNVEYVVKTLVKDCRLASERWDILALPGVEITHVPKDDIDLVAREAKELGARLVVVHGETIVEPVEPGTNRAAISSGYVDTPGSPCYGMGPNYGMAVQLPATLLATARLRSATSQPNN